MNFEDIYFEIPTRKIVDLKRQLKDMISVLSQVQTNRSKMIEYNGYTDTQLKIKDEQINPEIYNHFRIGDKGVEIIWTNMYYDTETKTLVRAGKKYAYSIRYYNCKSNVYDKEVPYCYENTSYGRYENLDIAKSEFRKCVVDLLVQFGNCKCLSPFDFL